jgi:hypothetical protein
MKITVNKIVRELEKNNVWSKTYLDQLIIRELIKDVHTIIDEQLIRHKNITIKK